MIGLDFVLLVVLSYVLLLGYFYDKVWYYKRSYLVLKEICDEQKKIIEMYEKKNRDN